MVYNPNSKSDSSIIQSNVIQSQIKRDPMLNLSNISLYLSPLPSPPLPQQTPAPNISYPSHPQHPHLPFLPSSHPYSLSKPANLFYQLLQVNHLNKLMSLSKHKQKIRHYKSLQNLEAHARDAIAELRYKNTPNEPPRILKNQKRYGSSRFLTEANGKFNAKEEAGKWSQLLKSQSRPKKDEKKQRSQQLVKHLSSSQLKRSEKARANSPVISKFIAKTEFTEYEPLIKSSKNLRKPLKKEKCKQDLNFLRSASKIPCIESILIERHEQKCKNSHSKSREGLIKPKSKKKVEKVNTELSLQSTPSCLMSDEIEMIDLVDEGTFGKVFRGRLIKNGEIIAIKRVLQDSRYKNREIEIIKILKNSFIVQIQGSYITYEGGQEFLNIMMRYYEENLFHRISLYKKTRINSLEVKIILYQIFKGLSYLHSLGVCHRDIKPENILLKGCAAVICDFGSAKVMGVNESNISYICARCYRAPELIFGATKYSTVIDVWSAGCVILQILNGQPLFIGQTSTSHLLQIMKVMGTPTEEEVLSMNPQYNIKEYRFPKIKKTEWRKIFPKVEDLLLDLIDRVLVYDPLQRARVAEVLAHEYFDELRDRFTYMHIKGQYHLNDFFNFSEPELKGSAHLRPKLIPKWYYDHYS